MELSKPSARVAVVGQCVNITISEIGVYSAMAVIFALINKRKSRCAECGGSELCNAHKKRKEYCKECKEQNIAVNN